MRNILQLYKKKPLRYHRDCDSLSIASFTKIMETGEYRYLIMSWDGISELKYDRDEAARIWSGIYNEYCELTSNNRAIHYYKDAQRLVYLETRKYIGERFLVQLAIRQMKKKTQDEYVSRLRDLRFTWSDQWDKRKNIDDLSRQIRAAENEIGLLSDSLKKMSSNEETMPFEKQLVKVEQALGRNVVDPWKTSVKKWVFLLQEIKEINESRRKQANANKRQ